MSLIIATGSNLGDKKANLEKAIDLLSKNFTLISQSKVYSSPAVGKTDQPSFYNQVLEFKLPQAKPEEVMNKLLEIEQEMGRVRDVHWGPRIIDLDIIFWNDLELNSKLLTLPHPRWKERAFVVKPLRELPFFQVISKSHKMPDEFDHIASPIKL